MDPLRTARSRGRWAWRQPRRSLSVDSLLMDDELGNSVSELSERSIVHETTPTELSYSRGRSPATSFADPHAHGDDGEEVRRQEYSDGLKPPSPPAASNDSRTGRVTDWIAEIVALLVAICCLMAIFIILIKFNNQEQPKWSYASTLNLSTLIALIATVLRAML